MHNMEKNGRDGDDCGSGWLEVKKKHRSNAKLSIVQGIGSSIVRPELSRKGQLGFSQNHTSISGQVRQNSSSKSSSSRNPQKNENDERNELDKKTMLENKESDIGVQVHHSQVLEEETVKKIVEHSLQFGEIKPSVQAIGDSLENVESKNRATIRKHVQENCVRDTSNIVNLEVVSPIVEVPKIKWGNLEEDELKGTESTVMGTELNKHKNLDGLSMVEDKIPLVVSAAHAISKKNDSSCLETSRISEDMQEAVLSDVSCGNYKMIEVNSEKNKFMESSTDIAGKSEVSVKELNEKSIEIEEFCKVEGDSSIQNESTKVDECRSKPLLMSDETETASSQYPNSSSQGDCHICLEITFPDKVLAASEEIQESVSSIDNIDGYEGRENSSSFENISAAEYTNTTQDTTQLRAPEELISADSQVDREKFNEDRSIAENLLINAFEKGETGESKERFRQRLWCFLFENLNRAVDELYLLCELECDVEQMKEAVLVLEEAQSDFRELKTRVDGFDNARESSFASQTLSNATPITTKVEHRRPHALSWEVRRMASSPRRAEILSSSLEAFKKIQEESASKNATRLSKRRNATYPPLAQSHRENVLGKSSATARDSVPTSKEVSAKLKGKQIYNSECGNRGSMGERKHAELVKSAKENSSEARIVQKNPHFTSPQLSGKREGNSSTCNASSSSSKVDFLRPVSELDPASTRRLKLPLSENRANKNSKGGDPFRCQSAMDKEKDRRPLLTKTLDAWKEKRNWEDILASPLRSSSRTAHSPIVSRRSTERVRVLHDKLMSPERRRKSPLDMKKETDEKHARATRIRRELENERAQRLQRVSEKLTRVTEWQAVRNSKLREGMHARQQRGESRHEAYLAQISRRASDESNKVSEVRFITSLNEENKKLSLRQKLQDSELRRAERLQNIKIKQKEDIAREEAVLERRKLLEAEKLQRLAEIQRKKEEALARREEERKAASAAREAKAVEQVRKKEVRAKAQREEAELQAQKLAERLTESELRRKVYLEQIREKAAMDFREQSSPSLRRPSSKDGQQRSALNQSSEGYSANAVTGLTCFASSSSSSLLQQQSYKKRVKKIRQRLMALKYEFVEPPVGIESNGLGTIAVAGAARSKIGRWLQDLQRLQQARKAGAASTGLIIGEMIKYLEGKEAELHAARQAGLLDFIASALPASHTSKPEACQTTISLLRIMKVVLTLVANRSYFISRNLLPPLIPMLSTALENYCTIAASNNSYAGVSGNTTNTSTDKLFDEKLETIGEVLEGLLWSVAAIMGHTCSDERQMQMQDDLAELIVACKVIHHLHDLFSLFDRPQIEGAPFPAPVLLGLNLLGILTCRRGNLSFEGWEVCSTPVVMLPATQKFESADNEGTLTCVQDSSSEKIAEYYPFELIAKEGTQISELGSIMKEEAKIELPALEENEELKNAVCENGVNTKRPELTRVNMANISPEEAASWEWMDSCSSQMKGGGKSAGEAKTESDNTLSAKVDDQRVLARNRSEKVPGSINNRSVAFLVAVIAETGLVGLPSLLTAVLLQANPRANSEQLQAAYMLPVNFEEVATGVLKIMNNLAHLNLTLVQSMLARPDLQMEFFHLMSFLLSHCTGKWKTATDQAGQFIIEYCGEVISCKEARRRSQAYEAAGLRDAFIISLDRFESIDATKKGSFARFINHSCEPNCETRKWTVLGEIRVGIFAKQDIRCGTELAYDYNFEWYGGAKVRCRCGAPSCYGFLGAKSRGFQNDAYLWEDNDERYSVENVPLYDSDEDEPLSNFLKRAKVCKKLKIAATKQHPISQVASSILTNVTDPKLFTAPDDKDNHSSDVSAIKDKSALLDLAEIAIWNEKQEMGIVDLDQKAPALEMEETVKCTTEAMEVDNVNGELCPASNDTTVSENEPVKTVYSNHLNPLIVSPSKKSLCFSCQKSKHLISKRVNADFISQILPSKEAHDELLAAQETKIAKAAELNSFYDQIRPSIQDHGKDGQDSVPTHFAEEWIKVSCEHLKAQFDVHFKIVKHVADHVCDIKNGDLNLEGDKSKHV